MLKMTLRVSVATSVACLLLYASQVNVAQDKPAEGKFSAPNLDSITVEDLKTDVFFMASDEMRGRDTAGAESDIASAYIAARFRAAGLKPSGDNGTFYQDVQFSYREFVDSPTIRFFDSSKDLKDGLPSEEFKFGDDFTTMGGDALPMPESPIVFAGYAITDPQRGWDDFAGLDLKGKVALILRYEPTSWRGKSARGWSRNSYLETKAAALRKAGAVGVIMVSGPASTGGLDNWTAPKAGSPEKLSPPLQLADDKVADAASETPFYMASVKAIDRVLGGEGKLKALQEALDANDRSKTPDLSNLKVRADVKTRRVTKTGRNVVARIEGERDEWVVLGGHYDHIGLGYFGAQDSRTAMGQVHNGADDNASGTSSIMEIAQAFAKGPKPKRGLLFIAFTGEEKGLLGSEWYARHPLIAHEKTLAMINIDMIGRVRDKKLEMHGMASSKALAQHVRDVEPLFGSLKLKLIEQPVGPVSDMWAFYKAGIPVLFPFSGYNEVMHTAKDDPETINYEALADTTRLIAEIIWRVSETEAYPDYRGINKEAKGPDGKYRIPRKEEPKPADEEKEEKFSQRPR